MMHTTSITPDPALKCPVCNATFRGEEACPRCGTTLRDLMRLAARAWALRRMANAQLQDGNLDKALQYEERAAWILRK